MIFTVEEKVKGVTLEEELKRNPECPVENFHTVKNWMSTQSHLPKIPGNLKVIFRINYAPSFAINSCIRVDRCVGLWKFTYKNVMMYRVFHM